MRFQQVIATSLVELVASMAIISISLTSVALAYVQVAKAPSANAMQNALTIASNYLNEILGKNFPTTLPCPAPPANRQNYTNVCDYKNLVDVGAQDSNGNPITAFAAYTVAVTLDTSTAATLGTLTGGTTAAAAYVVRIDLTVSNVGMPNFIISAYKGKN
jgi:type II secretory pathway pseudopilin PulG